MSVIARTPSTAVHLRPTTADVVLAAGPLASVLLVLACLAGAADGSGGPGAWAVALVALALGVPHGAVDHLALAAPRAGTGLVRSLVYLLVAALATAAVLLAPLPGFVVVLALTVHHFGTGEVEAWADLAPAPGAPASRGVRFSARLSALAFGAAAVVLPLTGGAGGQTLARLQPALEPLALPALAATVRVVAVGTVVLAVAALLARRRLRPAAELVVLTATSLVAPPLLAFAVYFTAWHALRHTARLASARGHLDPTAMARTFAAGLPALALVLPAAVVLARSAPSPGTTTSVLWAGLAVVWGLTVPHMAVVAAFDRDRRSSRRAVAAITEAPTATRRSPSAPAPATPAGT